MSLTLASASAARAAMLRAAGVEIDVKPARVDEAAIKSALLAEGAPARDIADALAELKAVRISSSTRGLVLGADQVLLAEGRVFDKPADMAAARSQLLELRGGEHQLLSAAVIAEAGMPVWRHVGVARLRMRPFTESFLEAYLSEAGDAVLSSVGAYHLEGLGAQLFASLEGDHFTILGLPLLPVLGFLRARGELVE